MTLLPPNRALVEKLAIANRILYDQGVVDGFGHVSVRHDGSPAHFLLARNMAPGLVTADDILTFDLDGDAQDARGLCREVAAHREILMPPTGNVVVTTIDCP